MYVNKNIITAKIMSYVYSIMKNKYLFTYVRTYNLIHTTTAWYSIRLILTSLTFTSLVNTKPT